MEGRKEQKNWKSDSMNEEEGDIITINTILINLTSTKTKN